jgi:drug/metabolite transporter (DMT)-like permease
MTNPLIQDTPTLSAPTVAILVLLSFVWGATFIFIALSLRGFPPTTTVALRLGIAALILVPFAWSQGQRLPQTLAQWRPFVFVALFNNVLPFTLFAISIFYISTSLAGVLNATTPLFTLLIARLVMGQPVAGNKLMGLVLGIFGVAVLMGPDVLRVGLGWETLGMIACLAACLCYSISAQLMRQFSGQNPIALAASLMTMSTMLIVPMALVIDRPWTLPTPPLMAWVGVLSLAALSTAIAYILFFRIVVTAGPNNAQLVTLLIPITAMLLGATWFGETIGINQMFGAAIIICGLLAIDGRVLGWFQRT